MNPGRISFLESRKIETPNTLILCLRGAVDCTQTGQFYKIMEKIRGETGKGLLIDLVELEYIDSSGLGALVAERSRWVKLNRDFSICSLSPTVKRIFQASRLDRVFKIYSNQESAQEEQPG